MGLGLDSAGDGVHKLNHAVQRLLVLSGPLVSLGKEAGTHAASPRPADPPAGGKQCTSSSVLAVSGVISGFII